MFPYLNLFGFSIPLYGICIFVGIALAVLLAVFRAKRAGLNRDDVFYACLFAGIGLIVGGKLLYLVTVIPVFVERPELLASQEIWKALMMGGFVFYGGLIGALLMVWWYTKLYKIPVFSMLDGLIPSVPLAHAFGRLGCFFAGCCYGVPSAFGFEFNASELAPHGVKLLPVQLIEAGCNLALFALLLVLSRFCRRRGVLTGTYLAAYAVMRFVLEFFRYDAERGVFWGLSTSQWISVLLLPAAVLIVCFAGRKKSTRAASAENEE